jgi:hypothetical protein
MNRAGAEWMKGGGGWVWVSLSPSSSPLIGLLGRRINTEQRQDSEDLGVSSSRGKTARQKKAARSRCPMNELRVRASGNKKERNEEEEEGGGGKVQRQKGRRNERDHEW